MFPIKLIASKKNKSYFLGKNQNKFAYTLLAPTLIFLALLMIYPLCWTVGMSFTDKRVGLDATFNGLANYITLLKDPIFLKTIVNTLIYTACAVVLKIVLGMVMALVLNSKRLRARSLMRSLLYLPWALPTLVSIYAWKWMFSDVGGAINFILQKLGFINQQIGWFSTVTLAMISVVIVNVWRGTPFLGISILSGLQTVNQDMYEAASIDGANAWRQFWSITLPQVKNVVLLASIITTIWTLNDFEIIWLLTRGGPDNGTQVFSTLSYTYGFLNRDLGLSVAISVFTLPVLIFLVGIAAKKSMSDSAE